MPWQSNNSQSGDNGSGDGGSGGGGPWGSSSGGGGSGGGGPWGGSSGGGGSGGGGPWSGGPGGGGPPPNFEDALRRGQDRIKRFFPPGRSGRGIALIILVVVAGWLLTGFYRVDASQQGVVLIFGELWSQTGPGLHYNLPAPIGEVITPEVTRVNRIEIGFQSNTRQGSPRNITAESLMLTGDENIIDVQFVMFWRIKNAADFLFKVRNQEQTVKAAAEGSMREIMGKNDFEFARTSGRGNITNAAKLLTQEILDTYQSGITITQVEVQKVDPPEAVIDAFRDVQAARADKERAVNEATAYANEITQRAEGEASQILASAEAYKQEQIAKASGETQRFLSVYAEYLADKDVTRRRLYLETMEKVLHDMDKVLLEDEGGGTGVLPYLPLDSLKRDRSEGTEEKTKQ